MDRIKLLIWILQEFSTDKFRLSDIRSMLSDEGYISDRSIKHIAIHYLNNYVKDGLLNKIPEHPYAMYQLTDTGLIYIINHVLEENPQLVTYFISTYPELALLINREVLE